MVAAAAGLGLWLLPAGRARARVQRLVDGDRHGDCFAARDLVGGNDARGRLERGRRASSRWWSCRTRCGTRRRWRRPCGSRGFACKACGFPSTFARWRGPGAAAARWAPRLKTGSGPRPAHGWRSRARGSCIRGRTGCGRARLWPAHHRRAAGVTRSAHRCRAGSGAGPRVGARGTRDALGTLVQRIVHVLAGWHPSRVVRDGPPAHGARDGVRRNGRRRHRIGQGVCGVPDARRYPGPNLERIPFGRSDALVPRTDTPRDAAASSTADAGIRSLLDDDAGRAGDRRRIRHRSDQPRRRPVDRAALDRRAGACRARHARPARARRRRLPRRAADRLDNAGTRPAPHQTSRRQPHRKRRQRWKPMRRPDTRARSSVAGSRAPEPIPASLVASGHGAGDRRRVPTTPRTPAAAAPIAPRITTEAKDAWAAATQAGESIGLSSKKGAVATAGFFTRLSKKVATSF